MIKGARWGHTRLDGRVIACDDERYDRKVRVLGHDTALGKTRALEISCVPREDGMLEMLLRLAVMVVQPAPWK